MGMTMAEKILARASGLDEVKAGQYVTAKVDRVMAHDLLANLYNAFKDIGIDRVWDPDRLILVCDHIVPARDIPSAEGNVRLRKFVREYGITHWYDVGRGGVCHQVFPEKGHALPGTLVIGLDSHTTSYGAFNCASTAIQAPEAYWAIAKGECWFRVPETIRFELSGQLPDRVMGKDVILKIAGDHGTDFALYRSLEFVGPAVEKMSLADRWAMANMGVEVGAKFALFEVDEKTLGFLRDRTNEPFTPVVSDRDAVFEQKLQLDVTHLEPQVALPHDVCNVKPISQVGRIPVDQAFLGSCTGGRLEDLEIAATIVKGKRIYPDVRMIVIPASMEIYRRALDAGLLDTFVDAGAFICGPTCGPCMGGHAGILAAGEKCVSASNRNFQGRMGSPESEVYLASPATVAASAVAGFIADPRQA